MVLTTGSFELCHAHMTGSPWVHLHAECTVLLLALCMRMSSMAERAVACYAGDPAHVPTRGHRAGPRLGFP